MKLTAQSFLLVLLAVPTAISAENYLRASRNTAADGGDLPALKATALFDHLQRELGKKKKKISKPKRKPKSKNKEMIVEEEDKAFPSPGGEASQPVEEEYGPELGDFVNLYPDTEEESASVGDGGMSDSGGGGGMSDSGSPFNQFVHVVDYEKLVLDREEVQLQFGNLMDPDNEVTVCPFIKPRTEKPEKYCSGTLECMGNPTGAAFYECCIPYGKSCSCGSSNNIYVQNKCLAVPSDVVP